MTTDFAFTLPRFEFFAACTSGESSAMTATAKSRVRRATRRMPQSYADLLQPSDRGVDMLRRFIIVWRSVLEKARTHLPRRVDRIGERSTETEAVRSGRRHQQAASRRASRHVHDG